MAANQPFRGIVKFQALGRRFVSPFFAAFCRAPIPLAPLKSDLLIIAVNSEKGKALSAPLSL
jgi:hypothetical protein